MREKKTFNTNDSQLVPHVSTELAQRCLVSEIGRDRTFSPWYDRTMLTNTLLAHRFGIESHRLKQHQQASTKNALTWARTRDLSVNSRALCQLSHEGIVMTLHTAMVLWCNWLALWTLNPAIRVQIPVGPLLFPIFILYLGKGKKWSRWGSNPRPTAY